MRWKFWFHAFVIVYKCSKFSEIEKDSYEKQKTGCAEWFPMVCIVLKTIYFSFIISPEFQPPYVSFYCPNTNRSGKPKWYHQIVVWCSATAVTAARNVFDTRNRFIAFLFNYIKIASQPARQAYQEKQCSTHHFVRCVYFSHKMWINDVAFLTRTHTKNTFIVFMKF